MHIKSESKEFRHTLAAWYADAQRPLPWRTQPSLYRTVVSELMAQQTQIKTMLPYFERWVQRFPNFQTLAAAPAATVLKHWEGLGYYSRARNLHQLAKEYCQLNPKPRSRQEWQQLPGIGPYTSAAISSIALGEPAAVVDGNVVRILARLSNDTRVFKNNAAAIKAFTPLAEQLLDHDNPGDHNQAMMELGATLCHKRKPLCTVCPVVRFCAARKQGHQDTLPQIARKATVSVELNRAWVLQAGKLLLHRIPKNAGQLAGQYELPQLATVPTTQRKGKLIATKSRAITHRRIKESIYQIEALPTQDHSLQWIALDDLPKITLSGPHRRWIEELLAKVNATPA